MSPLPPTRERPVTRPGADGAVDAAWAVPEPQRGLRRWLRRIGIVLLIMIAVILGAAGAVLFYAKNQIDDLVTPRSAQMRLAQKQLEAPLPGQPANILLLGSDHRKYTTGKTDQRSDTLMLVRLDPKRKTISMLSFPRDLYVSIPGHGQAKLNEAYYNGGPSLAVQTIKQLTDLDVNFVMNVDFTGFRGVVDQLGGVWVDVDRTYLNTESDQTADIDIKPGYQLLNGHDALDYSRFRHDTRGDFNRIARQQQVLAGLKKQVGSSSLARNVPGLFRVFKKNTEVVAGGGNSVDARVLYDYLRLALKLDGKDVYNIEYEGLTGTGPGGASIVEYDKERLDTAVKAFLSPNSSAREATADQLVGKRPVEATAPEGDATKPEPVVKVPAPSTVSVKVLNGSGTGGVARDMAQQLSAAGYQVDPSQTNADAATYANTRVQYATEAGKGAAEALADRISGATAQPKDGSNAFSTQLLVIVGRTGTKLEAPGSGSTVGTDDGPSGGEEYAGNKVPPKAAAKVTTDVESGREQFVGIASRRMPVLYPTVREQTSSYEEVYRYEFARGSGKTVYDAYRLVAKTSDGDYWGLQATSWPDPPILEGPTREVVRGRRTYQLYFIGTKLHMVAWHEGAGTYWVSNSVLNNLSNETMLAIADGVKPFR